MTASKWASDSLPHATRWLPLLDTPPELLPPLAFSLLQAEWHGRAHTLTRALHVPDLRRLSSRLLGQPTGRPALHAAHLHALTSPLPPALARAFCTALGVQASIPSDERSNSRPRLSLLRLPVLRKQARMQPFSAPAVPDDPATRLELALTRISSNPSAVSTFNAALCSQLLSSLTRNWLDDRSSLHLELLCGLGENADPNAVAAFQTARQHVLTTLSGTRRRVAQTLITEARAQHAALQAHCEAQDQARHDLIRAAVVAAQRLAEQGYLNRVADAKWLTVTELREVLDGLINPAQLKGLTQLRRDQFTELPATTQFREVVAHSVVNGQALAPGVRDGKLALWQSGQIVPDGAVALCRPVRPYQLQQLRPASALILAHSTEFSRAAAYARAHGIAAISVEQLNTDWLKDGALVRLNGHQGTLTLLRRAGEPPPHITPTPFDLDLDNLLESPHVRVIPRQVAFNLEFETA